MGYPVAYFVISRSLRGWASTLDGGVWANFTSFAAYSLWQGAATTFMGAF